MPATFISTICMYTYHIPDAVADADDDDDDDDDDSFIFENPMFSHKHTPETRIIHSNILHICVHICVHIASMYIYIIIYIYVI